MIRSLLLVVGLVAAAFADDYAFNQIYEMAERIEVCLKPVKDQSSFELPAGMCLMETRWSRVGGLAQDMVPADVASCLKERNVPNDTVATVEECLVDSMAVPLKPALEEADYSAERRRDQQPHRGVPVLHPRAPELGQTIWCNDANHPKGQ
ncbi:uncharacterized protein LOC117647835 [Thrips palmi]|uniref:Uncharacterized protein LOC117647835 n=1 Tax=Thrips palmi TaxID=161013 RepID=A0A6P8YZU6_THRPL|nr:uncharacterized protein LOC117647835 [Thrips palmi]